MTFLEKPPGFFQKPGFNIQFHLKYAVLQKSLQFFNFGKSSDLCMTIYINLSNGFISDDET